MPRTLITTLAAVILVTAVAVAQEAREVQLAEPFDAQYAGEDATGERVIALWQFDGDDPHLDVSGNGHDLQLRGAQFVPDGKFGGALESFRGWPEEDVPHQAIAANTPRLTPKGAFTIEMWICPRPELDDYGQAFLMDKKYIDHTDYQLTLGPPDGLGQRVLFMRLGFGADTETYGSRPVRYEPGEWRHIAFTYDGAGTGRFFVDGTAAGEKANPARGAIAPGRRPLYLADRVGSYYYGFPGLIDQVRICDGALEFRAAGFEVVSMRRVFVRMEQEAALEFVLSNKLRTPLAGARAQVSLGAPRAEEIALPELPSGARHVIRYVLDTTLRPDTYRLRVAVEMPGERPYRSSEEFPVTIVARETPHKMPVVMWGAGLGEVDRLKDLGFTHAIGVPADFGAIWEAGQPTDAIAPERVPGVYEQLDYALANGIGAVAGLSPGRWARGKEEFRRVGPDGSHAGREDVCGLFPEIQAFCYNVGASVARTFGPHPALQSALIHTEVRGESATCYHDHDREAFRNFAGFDIPEGIAGMRGTPYANIPDFPADRVIPDDHPMYVYYRWLWSRGDGWNALHTALHDGLKSTGRRDLWTFHDPAVRAASVYGSGGDVDVLGHWTYSYPDPIRIGLCTDDLLAMAAGAARPDQQVMKMTQIIWYRSQTAPEPGEEARVQHADFIDQDTRPRGTGAVDAEGRYQAAWEREIPDARFITIAPMHLREAFWTKISRPITGIMYHGWQSLVDTTSHSSYRYTHPETRHELRRLVRTVVEPLGPTLAQVPDRPADVAFLHSFASQMFARKGTWGWNTGWIGDAYLIMMYAHLQPEIIYDETIERRGLDGYKVLVLVDCDVLTQTAVNRIKAFQNAGGIIIADEHLTPALQPDILLESHPRPKEADQARALLQQKAAALRAELDPHYTRHVQASTPDIITRARTYGAADYVFAVNDLREFGDYVGHHGLVMENGLPTSATLNINRTGVVVYDLVSHREVRAHGGGNTVTVDLDFGPCEGRLLMVTSQIVDAVRIEAPQAAAPGASITIRVTVVDTEGEPLYAIVPVRVELLDPHGRAAEFSGYYGAKDGRVEITALLAANDVPGLWRLRATELASGREASAYMRVAGGE